MTELSNLALAIRTGFFLNPRTTLCLRNEKSRLTAEAQAAMNELVAAGILSATQDGAACIYRLTEAGAELPPQSLAWMAKHGKVSIVEPIPQEQGT